MSSFETERTLQTHAKKIVLGLIKIHEFTENQRIVLKIFFCVWNANVCNFKIIGYLYAYKVDTWFNFTVFLQFIINFLVNTNQFCMELISTGLKSVI